MGLEQPVKHDARRLRFAADRRRSYIVHVSQHDLFRQERWPKHLRVSEEWEVRRNHQSWSHLAKAEKGFPSYIYGNHGHLRRSVCVESLVRPVAVPNLSGVEERTRQIQVSVQATPISNLAMTG